MLGERWLPIAGYEGLYEVSDLGRVRGLDRLIAYKGKPNGALCRSRIISGAPDRKGYLHLVLCREGKQKTFFVSRLVAVAFVPNPDGLPDVNHLDCDKSNNTASNLGWTDHKGNISHSVGLGRYAKKLTSKIVSEIRTRASNGESQASISRDLGLRYQTVHLIVNRHSWCHVE